MNNKIKKYIYFIIFVFISIIVLYLYIIKKYDYLIILLSLDIFVLILFIRSLIVSNYSDKKLYDYNLNNITRLYNSILVRTSNLPNIKSKNIIKVISIDDLLNIENEIKKPIYYYKNNNYSIFYIIDNNYISYFILKQNEKIIIPFEFENQIKELKIDLKDKCNIIQVNKKYYKVELIMNNEVGGDEETCECLDLELT